MKIKEKNGNFIIVDFTEAEAYKIACKIEEDGVHFYKKLLEKSVDKKVKDAVSFMLKEEEDHLKYFTESLFSKEEKEEESFEGDDLLSSMDYGIFQPYQNLDELERIIKDPQKALKLGILIENNSIRFYETCREEVKDSRAKKELENIIEEENKHKKILQDMLKK